MIYFLCLPNTQDKKSLKTISLVSATQQGTQGLSFCHDSNPHKSQCQDKNNNLERFSLDSL